MIQHLLFECLESATISSELRRTKKLGLQENIKLLLEVELPAQEERRIFKKIIEFF